MGCTIPNFNLDVKVKYDITTSTPTVVIDNQSTGANLANIIYWFELYTPSGVMYHQGTPLSPDKSGVWTTFNVAENIPQSNGKIEFDVASPYIVKVFARDNASNNCDLELTDIICAPNGNKGANNFGATLVNVLQKCADAVLQVTDTSNYLYKGIVGTQLSSQTTLVYPISVDGVQTPNYVVNNKNAFIMPIPVNGKGHQLIRNSNFNYILPSGNEIKIKYKYKNSSFEINCGVQMCSIMCGLTKYRESLQNEDGTCKPNSESKIANLSLKIAQLTLALNSPMCGFDSTTLYAEIKEELFLNGCVCEECEDNSGNNPTIGLKCADIDIACVWDSIATLLNTTPTEKAKLCTLVTDCVNAMNSGCSQVFMSGVVFTPTKITANFILSNVSNSNNVEVFYKLHSSSTWISASGLLPSNSTTYDINGTFTQSALYDVKVVNHCASNVNVDSAIVSGIIPAQLTACTYLNDIYSGLGDGVYSIKVDNSQTGCAKYTYQLIDGTFVQSLMPCPTPVNVKVDASGFVSFTGKIGDYEIAYKLKTAPTYTIFSISNYATTDSSANLSSVLIPSVNLFDIRVRYKCGTSNFSLPIYCDLSTVGNSQCQSPADFISYDETTGDLRWYGAVGGATYIIKAITQASPSGVNPLSVALSGNTIIVDYANLVPLLNVDDEVLFSIQRDCGNGNLSDKASKLYIIKGAIQNCPQVGFGFSYSGVENDTIVINGGGGSSNPSPLITSAEYEMSVNGVVTNYGMVNIKDGNTETKVKSSIPLKQGDYIRFRYRSICSCCDNVTPTSAWTAFGGTTINLATTGQGLWDDVWKAVPSGWVNPKYADAYLQYKIDKQGKMQFRGGLYHNNTDHTVTTGTNINFLVDDIVTIPTAIYNSLNPSTLSTSNVDLYAGNFIYTANSNEYIGISRFTRNGNVITVTAISHTNSGVTLSTPFPMSHISIQ